MSKSAELFKDEVIHGISTSIQSLLRFQTEKEDKDEFKGITKDNLYFKNLSNFLDFGLSFGLIYPKKGYWSCMKILAHPSIVKMVESHASATNNLMKSHLWLFLSILEDSLASYLALCFENTSTIRKFYKECSFLRDEERLEVLRMLLVGLDSVKFDLTFADPYIEFGRDNMAKPGYLRPSSFVRIESPDLTITSTPVQPKTYNSVFDRPDITLGIDDGSSESGETISVTSAAEIGNGAIRRIGYEDLPASSPVRNSDDDDLVARVVRGRRKSKNKSEKIANTNRDSRLSSTDADCGTTSEVESLADDHFIPDVKEVVVDVEIVNDQEDGPTVTSTNSFSPIMSPKSEGQYKSFLDSYAGNNEKVLPLLKDRTSSSPGSHELSNEYSMKEVRGGSDAMYQMTYLSEDEIDDHHRSGSLDSFDRFCRKQSRGSSMNSEDIDILNAVESIPPIETTSHSDDLPTENDHSTAILTSPRGVTLTPQGVQKILAARLESHIGMLLPNLPHRPSLMEGKQLYQHLNIDQNTILLLSLEIFQHSDEQLGKMFKVVVGHLFGYTLRINLMLTDYAVYFLIPDNTRECGFYCEASITYDSINQIQPGTGHQDILIKSDSGLYHVWTGDEIETRIIIMALKCKLTSGAIAEESLFATNASYNNELECLMKDWLMLIEDEEEPDLMHFALVHYFGFSDAPPSHQVVKSGFLQCKQTYLGVMSKWEPKFIVLRGSRLYMYSSKGEHELQQVVDLRTKCGGCVQTQEHDKNHTFKIVRPDGTTPLIYLASTSEVDASDWITSICHVFADVKSGSNYSGVGSNESIHPCGIMMTSSKIYMILQESRSGRLSIHYTCLVKDVIQVYVDNDDRKFCALNVDYTSDVADSASKRILIMKFASEFELGKFEQKLFACWQVLYQVPLQFVLLSDGKLKTRIMNAISNESPLDPDASADVSVGAVLRMS